MTWFTSWLAPLRTPPARTRRRRAPRRPELEPLEARRLLAAALIRDINAATVSSEPAELVNVNGVLYFTADDGIHGRELWKSDGTAAGTTLVKDIFPGAGSSTPTGLTSVNGTLFFAANDGAIGTELWKVVGGVTGLVVSSFTPTSTGFTVQFSQPVDPSVLNLYDTQADLFGPADVTVTGSSTGPVRGSLVLNAAANRITFIQTDATLPADTYTVVLRSAANGFRTPAGALLDGNGDGTPGDNYTTTFSVAPFAGVIVSVPDFLVGPGQPVNVPASSTGLPLRLSDGAGLDPSDGLEAADIALSYDATRLEVLPGGVRRGTLTGDFNLFAVHVDAEAGTSRIGLGRSAGGITGRGGGSLVLITFADYVARGVRGETASRTGLGSRRRCRASRGRGHGLGRGR